MEDVAMYIVFEEVCGIVICRVWLGDLERSTEARLDESAKSVFFVFDLEGIRGGNGDTDTHVTLAEWAW